MNSKKNAGTFKKKRGGTARYTRENLKKRNIRFYVIWLVLVGLIAWGLLTVHSYFQKNLTAYEAAQYNYVADDMAKIFTEKRFDELFEYEHCDVAYMESGQDYVDYLSKLTEGREITYKQIQAENVGEIRYAVTADDLAFAQFTLKKTGEVASFEVIPLIGYTVGVDLYEPGEIYMNILQPVTYDYTVPSYATITVNGRELNDGYKTGEKTIFYDGHLPDKVKLDSYSIKSYRFTCALGTPEVEVKDADGNVLELTAKENNVFVYEFPYDDEDIRYLVESKAYEFIRNWCMYSTHNIRRPAMLEQVVTDSAAHDFIMHYDIQWITEADEYGFGRFTSCNYALLTDNVISCEVAIVYNTVTSGVENTYETKCRLYFTGSGDSWKVYDFEMM